MPLPTYLEEDLNFRHCRILVLGDLILDHYIYGSVHRVSPEAPVPVVKVNRRARHLGGAGNVAHNLVSLGGNVTLISACGKDESANELRELLEQNKIAYQLFEQNNATITKTRIIGEHQQIARIDVEQIAEPSPQQIDEIFEQLKKEIKQFDVVVISDYGKGFCTPKLCQELISECKKWNKKVIVDPKGRDWSKYAGAFIVTPNLQELREVSQLTSLENENTILVQTGQTLVSKYALQNILITRSAAGMTLLEAEKPPIHISSNAQEVFDVSGAGDTVVAALAIAVAKGLSLSQAAQLANQAAGIAVSKMGTTPVTIGELLGRQTCSWLRKIVTLSELLVQLNHPKLKSRRIVFTNGCFDLFHAGHLHLLTEAKKQGDILIVAVNSDTSIHKLKGNTRPIVAEKERMQILAALEVTDFIISFSENTPEELIKQIKPQVLVKGGDYQTKEVVGRAFVEKVHLVHTLEGFSTTALLQRLQNKT